PSVLAISPVGTAAVVYDRMTQSLQILRNLPQSPEVTGEIDLSGMPGRPSGVALSDDGTVAVVSFINDDGQNDLWVIGAAGPSRVGTEGVAIAAFFPNRHDVMVADNGTQSAFLIMDVDQVAARVPVFSPVDGFDSFTSVSLSGDGRNAFF